MSAKDNIVVIDRQMAIMHCESIQDAINWLIDIEDDPESSHSPEVFSMIKRLRMITYDLDPTLSQNS